MNAAFCCAQVAEGVDKIGPCGGGGGEHYDTIKIPHCLKSITVWNGLIIDSIQFSYQDREKTLHTTDRWGGPGGFEQVTVIFVYFSDKHIYRSVIFIYLWLPLIFVTLHAD